MQQQIGQLLEARAELHAQLPVAELRQVWDHCMDFVGVAGRIYGTKGKLLLSTLLRQARDSLEFMHKNQLIHLQSLLHEELWKPALVSSALQSEVSGLQDNPRVRFHYFIFSYVNRQQAFLYKPLQAMSSAHDLAFLSAADRSV